MNNFDLDYCSIDSETSGQKKKKNTHTQRKEKKRGGNGNEEMITSNKKDQSQGRLVPASFSLAANLDAKLVPPGGHFL